MTGERIIRARWTGDALQPVGGPSLSWCRETMREGEVVAVDIERERSMASHNQQFAQIRDMWETLPESLADAPYSRNPEALRKHALLATGWAEVETTDAGSKAAAERIAPVIQRLAKMAHGYCIVKIRGPIITCATPVSQSVRAMGRADFQRSKDDCLRWIGDLLEAAQNEDDA